MNRRSAVVEVLEALMRSFAETEAMLEKVMGSRPEWTTSPLEDPVEANALVVA